MKMFKLTRASSVSSTVPESVAMRCLYDQDDMAKLHAMEVGAHMRDADGDLWERTA